jgi:hypothetical protein
MPAPIPMFWNAVLLFFAAAVFLRAQGHGPDYNFFDSRTLSPPAAALRASQASSPPEFAPGVTMIRHPSGGWVEQLYRIGGALTPPAAADAEGVARGFLHEHGELLGLNSVSAFALPLERRYESGAAGLTHLVFQPQHGGISVFGGSVLVHVARDGSVVRVQSGAGWVGQAGLTVIPALDALEAVRAAERVLAPGSAWKMKVVSAEPEGERKTVLSADGVADRIPARLVWFPGPRGAALAWELFLPAGRSRWYCAVVDAATGELLFSHNMYRDQRPQGSVFRAGAVPNPNAGPQTLESFTGWPAAAGDCPAPAYPSQYRAGALLNRCWVGGADTSGNNVVACLDASGTNQCDWKPASPQADFQFPFTDSYALLGSATPDQGAAVTNLFYWNNVLHDWLYSLGFDEPSGNFQMDNFGRGGFGGDPVLADAQDGQGLNNASFATPPDGSAPRMEMYLFTANGTYLRRDGDFSGDIIAHEYVHGLTTRLVGGAGNVNVLPLLESAALGEGWSDAYACSLTGSPVFGAYVGANPATGIRSVAYDNSPYTFGRFGTLSLRNGAPLDVVTSLPEAHRDGEIWASVLWDLRRVLGKSTFELLVTTALKLTPPRPSMLDARNAILQAAQAAGVSQCAVWAVFAGRGFGASAQLNHIQAGQPNDTALSLREAYDQPGPCGGLPPQAGPTVFFDDVESGSSGWTATGLWHVTSRRAAGGLRSWWYGQEASGNYATGARNSGALTSPPVTLPPGAPATLEWDQLFRSEGFGRCYLFGPAGCQPYLNYDSGWVMISRDGGAAWDTVTTLAHNSDGAAFDHHSIDISRYAGSTILIRFYFDTIDALDNLGEGWYIDNVAVRRVLTGTPSLGVAPASLQFSAVTGGAMPAPQPLAIANLDLGVLNWTAAASPSGWLAAAPASGSGNAVLSVSAAPNGLAPGAYNGAITVTAPGAANSPAVIPVTLSVAGPVAEWRFDEAGAGAGVVLVDTSGNGHSGITHGYGTAPYAGVAGGARSFNGFTDWAAIPASPSLSPPAFTFRAWVRLLSYPAGDGWGVVAANYGGNYQGWYVAVTAAGRVVFSVASLPSNAPWLLSGTTLGLGRWYSIAAAYDGITRQGSIYINGTLDAQAVFPGFTPQSTLPLTFGRASWCNGYYLNAAIDESRLLPAAQAPPQALADYQSFSPPPAPVFNTALIADWHFDDAAGALADSSGNAHGGAFSGTAVTAGILSTARRFNGSTDSAVVPASDAFGPSSFTVRFWIELLSYPAAAGWGVAIANYNGSYQGWYAGVDQAGRIIFSVASLPAASPWVLSSAALALSRWYYVAATYDGASRLATIYIDGVAAAQALLPGFTPSPTAAMYFGRASWYDGYYLNAAIDEARVLPVSQSAAEIKADFQSFPLQPPAPAVAEWKLDDSGTVLADASGNGHTGAARGTTVVPGILRSARSFNGISDFVDVPASAAFSPAGFTLRAWVKLLALPSTWAALISNYSGDYRGWYLGVHSTGRVIFSVASLPASSPWLLSNAALSPGVWYCITATYDGATHAGAIYINAAQDSQAVFPGFTAQASADLLLGRASWYSGYYANAVLDEVRLLGVRQSPAEVLADFQSFP